jgi:hypothetical protein
MELVGAWEETFDGDAASGFSRRETNSNEVAAWIREVSLRRGPVAVNEIALGRGGRERTRKKSQCSAMSTLGAKEENSGLAKRTSSKGETRRRKSQKRTR